MATRGVFLLAILFYVRQTAAATTCSVPTTVAPDCDDGCNELGVCLANGVWQSYQNCQVSGRVCRDGACVVAANPNHCNDYFNGAVTCLEAGMYPGPPDCTHFYNCENVGDPVSPSQCHGSAFNTCTRSCGGVLQSGTCPAGTNLARCTDAIQVGIAPGNDRLYYICESAGGGLFRQRWNTCPTGTRFSITARGCVSVGVVGSCGTVCGSAATVPGPMVDRNSRCSFVWCYSRDNFVVRYCLPGWYYEHSQGGCIYGGGGAITC